MILKDFFAGNNSSPFRLNLKTFNFRDLFVIVVVSEIFTAGMNTVMSIIWWGHISGDLILIGSVDALIVSSLVGSLFIIFYGSLREAEGRYRTLVDERTAQLSKVVRELNNEIAEHKRDEQSLREAHDYAEAVIDSMHDAVAIINTGDYTISKVNTAFCEAHGITRTETVGRTCYNVIHGSGEPCSRSGEHCPLMQTLATGGHSHAEHVYFRKTGEMRYVEDSTSPVHDAGGRITRVVHVTRDITSRTLTELALRESEERFRQIFAQNDDPLFILDPYSHSVLDLNPFAEQSYRYKAEELIGRSVSALFDQPAYELFISVLRQTPFDTVQIPRATHMRKDGSRLEVSVRARVIRLKDREVLYCSFRDMTEKFRLEEEARQIQSRLIHANKMTSLGTLVSGVAHEINNPNNFILFNARLLSDAWQDIIPMLDRLRSSGEDFSIGGLRYDEMREAMPKLLAGISDGSSRIRNIVKNLKDFARPDRSGLDASVDVNEVVTVASSIMETQIKRHTNSFCTELARDLPAVKGSSQQLEQVVINLIMNALLSLPSPGAAVRVSTSAEGPDSVSIKIADEGVGMTPEVMERVVEPFYTTRLDQGGTGLGLSISYAIIKAHKGTLTFESQPDRGTTVCVTLPVRREGGSGG